MRIRLAMVAGVATLTLATPALAHVTVQPTEAVAGSFARFVVRVPNERDDAVTTKVEVQLPESLVAVSFQPKAGWTRTAETRPRGAPVEVFGEQVSDYIATVVWEGGRIGSGEFEEFGFSARLPDEPGTLEFPALQTYSSGEVVRWIGPQGSEEPAGRVATYSLGTGEEQPGELRVLADLAAGDNEAQTEEDDDSGTGVVLAVVGIALGAVALAVALLRRRAT